MSPFVCLRRTESQRRPAHQGGRRKAEGGFPRPFILHPSSLLLFNPSFILALVVLAAPALAQVTVVQDDENNVTTYQMVVSPAAEPEPAFKYRLLKHEDNRNEGNAATFYYRAQLRLETITKKIQDEYGDAYYDWMYTRDTPLDQIPIEKAKEALATFGDGMMEALREATSRKYCDWGWNLQDVTGVKVISFLLPEIQEARTLGRMLALRTRLAIAERRLDDALELTQMNYQLGRDVAGEPFLVCGLVGIAISSISNSHTLEIMAAPNSPNLYWAFAELPKPMVDLRPAVRFELGNGPRMFPLLQDAESISRSPDEWSRYVGDTVEELVENLGSGGPIAGHFGPGFRGPKWETAKSRLIGTALGLWGYTRAKAELVRGGMSVEEVEAMPVGQVLAIQASRAYRHTADEMEKLTYMSFSEMKSRKKEIEGALMRDGYMGNIMQSVEIIPVASLLLPAMQAARTAQERLTRDMAAMQVIEALRMHAAETGSFPATLDDIAIVPVPLNPATGKAFEYRLDGETAVLELPTTDGFRVTKRYEITLR